MEHIFLQRHNRGKQDDTDERLRKREINGTEKESKERVAIARKELSIEFRVEQEGPYRFNVSISGY